MKEEVEICIKEIETVLKKHKMKLEIWYYDYEMTELRILHKQKGWELGVSTLPPQKGEELNIQQTKNE